MTATPWLPAPLPPGIVLSPAGEPLLHGHRVKFVPIGGGFHAYMDDGPHKGKKLSNFDLRGGVLAQFATATAGLAASPKNTPAPDYRERLAAGPAASMLAAMPHTERMHLFQQGVLSPFGRTVWAQRMSSLGARLAFDLGTSCGVALYLPPKGVPGVIGQDQATLERLLRLTDETPIIRDTVPRVVTSTCSPAVKARVEGPGARVLRFRERLIKAAAIVEHYGAQVVDVVWEEVRAHNGVTAAHVYGELRGELMSFAEQRGWSYRSVPVGWGKLVATGSGAGSKQAVAIGVRRQWPGLDPDSLDASDALSVLTSSLDRYGLV